MSRDDGAQSSVRWHNFLWLRSPGDVVVGSVTVLRLLPYESNECVPVFHEVALTDSVHRRSWSVLNLNPSVSRGLAIRLEEKVACLDIAGR